MQLSSPLLLQKSGEPWLYPLLRAANPGGVSGPICSPRTLGPCLWEERLCPMCP